jgi:predicted HNH restriction endonuclease
MSRRLPHTPSSQIRTAMRRLWLRSRERAAALKATGYCCAECGKKQSRAKGRECSLEVHHIYGVTNWAEIEAAIRRYLLVSPDELVPLCKACHQAKHNEVNHGS